MKDVTIDRAAEIAALGLTVDAVFVPFSQSRNKAEKSPSLNWRVTVKRNGRDVLACDYGAGMAHCPSYNKPAPKAWRRPARMWPGMAAAYECENGFALGLFTSWGGFRSNREKPILPNPVDVLYSLHSDGGALDYATFEDWAAEYGYDADSRSGEATYRACLEIGLKLRAALGDAGLSKLAEIFQDY